MNTELVRLGDISRQVRGVTYNKAEASDRARDGYLPILRAGNITERGLDYGNLVYVPSARVSDLQRIREGDVVIAASSGSLDVVGKAARAVEDFPGGFGAFCKVLRPTAAVEARYFAHFFKTSNYRRRVSALAAGANINNLRNEHLDDLLIPLPSPSVQRRIADVLDRADALRTKRREALALLDDLTQSIFVDMFGSDTEVLVNWPTTQLGEQLDFLTSGSRGWAAHYVDAGDLFLRIQNVVGGELVLDDVAFVRPPASAEAKRTKVEAGDVLLSITADLGRVAVVPDELPAAYINQHLAILRTKRLNARFLATFLVLRVRNDFTVVFGTLVYADSRCTVGDLRR